MAHGRTLLVSAVIHAAARHHPQVEVVTRCAGGPARRTTYATIESRSRRLASLLLRLGLAPGDRVALLAWDGAAAMEAFLAVAGIGAAIHPLDPGLPPALLAEAVAAEGASLLFAEPACAAQVAAIAPAARHTLRRVIMLCAEAEMPIVSLPITVGLHCLEPLLAAEAEQPGWPALDETLPAALIETAGGSGRRRAVALSHRALVLGALVANQADGLGLRATDRLLAVGALRQFGAWGSLCAAPMAGAALLLPGPPTDGATLHRFAADERATLALGVPRAFAGLLAACAQAGPPAALRRLVCTGETVPADLAQGFARLGVEVAQVWGLAEAGPAATFAAATAATAALTGKAAERPRRSHGRPPFGLELRLRGADGQDQPWDGLAVGALLVRGPLLAEDLPLDPEGWFDTGDTASIDANGFLLLRDRAGDAIQAGGEWISATLVEQAALAHPDVAEAACIAAPHPKFQQRPLLLVVPRPGAPCDVEAVKRVCAGQLPAWWVPDTVLPTPVLPRTQGGRVDKATLRRHHASVYDATPHGQRTSA